MYRMVWVALLALSVLLPYAHSARAVTPLSIKEGEAAIPFTLLNLSGKEVSLSDFANKPVILFFWATWCPFCTEELPALQKKYNTFKAEGIEVLAIDIAEPQERVEKFVTKRNIELPMLLDKKTETAHAYRVAGIPTYVLIDSAGKIRFHGNTLPGDYSRILNKK